VIQIIDNFFEDVLFQNVKNHCVTKLHYTPKYYDDPDVAGIRDKTTHYGSRYILNNDPKLLDVFVQQANKKFNIKIKKLHPDCGVDMRNYDKFVPHTDTKLGAKVNVLVMISGPTAVNNGTVFFSGEKDKEELDIHVGFRENRALLFPSGWIHSAHLSNVPNLRRHTATLFVQDYERLV